MRRWPRLGRLLAWEVEVKVKVGVGVGEAVAVGVPDAVSYRGGR